MLENYGGGGHQFASGARLTDKGDVEKIIKDLNEVCKEYKWLYSFYFSCGKTNISPYNFNLT